MNLWEKFAKEDAEYYILSNKEIDYTTQEGQQYFYRTGKELMETLFSNVEGYLQSKRSALEIGSGIGRLTLPHAAIFENVSAVDISPTMLTRLKANARTREITNIQGFLPHEDWDKGSYDYVYSFIVFQHIPDLAIIREYITRIAACLSPVGVIQIQFDTRPAGFLYQLRNNIPDIILPKDMKKGIRRIRRSGKVLRDLFAKANLEILKELRPDSTDHTFILKRAGNA